MLLILTNEQEDAHIPFVTQHVKRFCIVDPKKLIGGANLTYTFRRGSIRIAYQGTSLDTVSAVWYRKPLLPPREELPVRQGFESYSYTALREHFFLMTDLFPDALWMSSYTAMLAASNKVRQLALASKLGFRVPETIFTSHPGTAKAFLQKYPVTIVKPQASYGFSTKQANGEDRWAFFYASKVGRGQHLDLTNLHLAPTIFQQAVEDIVGDIRVNVVGGRAFASLITNPALDKNDRVRDWRVGHALGTLHIEPFNKLPKKIEEACIAHVQKQGLTFGALDLVLDTRKQFWFLENNPNGQWAFVDDSTRDAIAEEIAFLLQHGKNRPKA